MKTKFNSNIIRTLLLVILTLILAISFVSCGEEEGVLSKEAIAEAMAAETKTDRAHAVDYFDSWGIPYSSFSRSKVLGTEILYRDYYVKDLPDNFTLAKTAVSLFLEYLYDETDLTNDAALTDALIICYVEAIGDPYSFYRTEEEFEDYDTDMSGSFSGIGVVVQYEYLTEIMTVTDVYIDSGAEDAGILPGDIIKKVNGTPSTELGYQKTVNQIRGEEGTRVNITVERDGQEITFEVVRKKVVEETVRYSLGEDKIGYIRITDFKTITYSQFKEAVDHMTENGAVGIIYDLRANPGGYLNVVLNMLDYIAPRGTTLVSFSDGYGDPIKASSNHIVKLPTVVLCNERTASAGELFTAAMRDFGVMEFFPVKTVGVKTFGKGVMQSTYNFTDGAAITLTVAYYNPPSGVNYDGVGIEPDIKSELLAEGDSQLDDAYTAMAGLLAN